MKHGKILSIVICLSLLVAIFACGLVIFAAESVAPGSKGEISVYLIAGQSNALGYSEDMPEDAEALCRFASDPLVGPAAGWKPHTDVAYSREVIRTVFSTAEAYAIVLRYDAILPDGGCIPAGTPVGNIRILFRDNLNRCRMKENEAFLDFFLFQFFI